MTKICNKFAVFAYDATTGRFACLKAFRCTTFLNKVQCLLFRKVQTTGFIDLHQSGFQLQEFHQKLRLTSLVNVTTIFVGIFSTYYTRDCTDNASYLPDIVFYIAANKSNITVKRNFTRLIELAGLSRGPQGK
jgi:hypothetical protein